MKTSSTFDEELQKEAEEKAFSSTLYKAYIYALIFALITMWAIQSMATNYFFEYLNISNYIQTLTSNELTFIVNEKEVLTEIAKKHYEEILWSGLIHTIVLFVVVFFTYWYFISKYISKKTGEKIQKNEIKMIAEKLVDVLLIVILFSIPYSIFMSTIRLFN